MQRYLKYTIYMQLIKLLTKLHSSEHKHEYILFLTLIFIGWLAAEFKHDFWPEIHYTYNYIVDTLAYYTGITFVDILELYDMASNLLNIVGGLVAIVLATYIMSVVMSNKCKYVCNVSNLSPISRVSKLQNIQCLAFVYIVLFAALVGIGGFIIIGDGIADLLHLDSSYNNIPTHTQLDVLNQHYLLYATSFASPYLAHL